MAYQEWRIQRRHWQHWAHMTQEEDKQNTKTKHRKLRRLAQRTTRQAIGEHRCSRMVRVLTFHKAPAMLLM